MEELFVPYTEGQRYLEKESRCLVQLYSNYLEAFTKYHVRLALRPRLLAVIMLTPFLCIVHLG